MTKNNINERRRCSECPIHQDKEHMKDTEERTINNEDKLRKTKILTEESQENVSESEDQSGLTSTHPPAIQHVHFPTSAPSYSIFVHHSSRVSPRWRFRDSRRSVQFGPPMTPVLERMAQGNCRAPPVSELFLCGICRQVSVSNLEYNPQRSNDMERKATLTNTADKSTASRHFCTRAPYAFPPA